MVERPMAAFVEILPLPPTLVRFAAQALEGRGSILLCLLGAPLLLTPLGYRPQRRPPGGTRPWRRHCSLSIRLALAASHCAAVPVRCAIAGCACCERDCRRRCLGAACRIMPAMTDCLAASIWRRPCGPGDPSRMAACWRRRMAAWWCSQWPSGSRRRPRPGSRRPWTRAWSSCNATDWRCSCRLGSDWWRLTKGWPRMSARPRHCSTGWHSTWTSGLWTRGAATGQPPIPRPLPPLGRVWMRSGPDPLP